VDSKTGATEAIVEKYIGKWLLSDDREGGREKRRKQNPLKCRPQEASGEESRTK